LIKYLIILISILILNACQSYNNVTHTVSVNGNISDKADWFSESKNIIELEINFNEPNEYLCSPADDITAPKRGCTFFDINNDLDPYDSYRPKLHVHMQTDNFENDNNKLNASFKIKGGFTRRNDQKSYSVKLDSKTSLLNGSRKIMLTKSQGDRSRIKNALVFNLLRKVPNIFSLNIWYFHVKINGEDYGLFNSAEVIDEYFLARRGFNKKDHIYNAVNFTFRSLPQLEIDKNGNPINEEEFSKIIEIKSGGSNVSKLIEMVKAIDNATTATIDSVVDKYFNRDNYLTWMALNMIFNNKDSIQHNYYLYNPENSNTFYFVPWDYDGAWTTDDHLGRYEYGLSNWWSAQLHNKFFKIKKNRDDLDKMVTTLREKYITSDNIQKIIDKYKTFVPPYQDVAPDSKHNNSKTCLETMNYLRDSIDHNIELYRSVIGSPMTFNQYIDYNSSTSTLNIRWTQSEDLEGNLIL